MDQNSNLRCNKSLNISPGHAGNLLICKLKADDNVQLAINSQLSREVNWSRKSSTIVQCQTIINRVSENHIFPTEENCYNFQASLASETPKLKTAVKEMVKTDLKAKWNNKVEKLEVQGDFIKLLITEDSDVSWKSYIYGVPKGVMEWAMRSSTNILATPDNLKRWKKVRSDLCKMCQVPN